MQLTILLLPSFQLVGTALAVFKGTCPTHVQPLVTPSFSDIPSAPQNLHMTSVDCDSATIEWSPPKSDGGAPLLSYIIEVKRPGEQKYTFLDRVKPRLQEYTAFGLEENEEYSFRVKAKNPAGESVKAAELDEPIKVPAAQAAIGECSLADKSII